MGYAVYRGALDAISQPSQELGLNILFNKGVRTEVKDLELLQKLEGSSDFEVHYTLSELTKLTASKSVNELKKWLSRSGVSDTRHLSTKKEVVEELKKVKLTK